MRVISTYDFRKNMADYIDEVYFTETPLLISKFNKPVVVIKPYKKGEDNYMEFYGFMADANVETGEEFVNRIRRSAKEKEYVKKLRNRNA